MPIKHVVSDWSGTLFRDTDEGKLWAHVGVSALKDSTVAKYVPTPRTVSLALTALQLKKLTAAYKRGEVGYDKIYELFNERVLGNIPKDMVELYVQEYAMKRKTQEKVDDRLLRSIQEVCGTPESFHILSTGYGYGITQILGIRNRYLPSRITANRLIEVGNGSRFNLDIYTADDKRRILEACIKNFPADLSEILFIGDSETDEACMDHMAMMGGKVAVPFFATDEFKERVARDYGALVPDSEQDFLNFLRK